MILARFLPRLFLRNLFEFGSIFFPTYCNIFGMRKPLSISLKDLVLAAFFVLAVSGAGSAQCLSGNCETGNGKFQYTNGDVYEGSLLNGKRHGTGTMVFNSKATYSGEWKNNAIHGRGVYKFVSGDRYEGEYANGVREGRGKYFFANGSYYEGEYRGGKRHGQGKLFNKVKNTIQEGSWIDDVFQVPSATAKKRGDGELLKLQVMYAEEIEKQWEKHKQLLAANASNLSAAQKRENINQRKIEMAGVNQKASLAISDLGDEVAESSRAYFVGRKAESEKILKLIDLQMQMNQADEKGRSTSASFLDQVLIPSTTTSKVPPPKKVAVSSASENPENAGRELFAVVEKNDTAAALELIKNGANVHFRSFPGATEKNAFISHNTLSVAVMNKNVALAKALLDAGADPNSSMNGYEETAFHSAAQIEMPEMMELFLKYKGDVTHRTQSGWTPLLTAANWNKGDAVVKMLLAAGADPNVYNSQGKSPLALAQEQPDKTMANTLYSVSNADIRANPITTRIENSPLGVNGSYPQPVYNIKPKAANASEMARPLWEAVKNQDIPEVTRLINAGAEVNSSIGFTPIITEAVERGGITIVKLLLEAGANPNSKDGQYGLSALHEAISRQRIDLVKLLLRYKADPNQQSKDGRTALHIAAIWNGNDKITAILIDAGANPKNITSDNRTAKSIAVSQNRLQIANLLDKALSQNNYSAGVAPSRPVNSEDRTTTPRVDYNLQAALKEYEIVHNRLEESAAEYVRAYNKYAKADPQMRSFMSGTRLSMIRASEFASSSVKEFLRVHGKYLPTDLRDHLFEDLGKFPPLP